MRMYLFLLGFKFKSDVYFQIMYLEFDSIESKRKFVITFHKKRSQESFCILRSLFSIILLNIFLKWSL